MRDYNLGFISNEAIYDHVKNTVESYRREITHSLLKEIKVTANSQFDFADETRGIYAIVSHDNYRTPASSVRKSLIQMQAKLLEDKDAVCYYVVPLADQSFDEEWRFEADGETFSNNRLRQITADKFYALAFDDPDAYAKLERALNQIVRDVIGKSWT